MKKKILTLLLASIMVFAATSMSAFALTPPLEIGDYDFQNQAIEIVGESQDIDFCGSTWRNINGGKISNINLSNLSLENVNGTLVSDSVTFVNTGISPLCGVVVLQQSYIDSATITLDNGTLVVDENTVFSSGAIYGTGTILVPEEYMILDNCVIGPDVIVYSDPEGDGIYEKEGEESIDISDILQQEPTAPIDPISKSMNVTCNVAQSYTLTIPAETELVKGQVATADVSVTDVKIGAGETLDVKVTSVNYDNGWNLITHVMYKLAYSIVNGSGDEVTNDSSVLSVEAGNASDSETLKFEVTGQETIAGEYQDTLSFIVEVN